MLKRITITAQGKFIVQDIDTNESSLLNQLKTGLDSEVAIDPVTGTLKAVVINLTLDQAKELARALGVMEIEVRE